MKPHDLDENLPIYKRLLEEIAKEGSTPADIQKTNPELAEFMRKNGILKIKSKTDLNGKDDLFLRRVKKFRQLRRY